MLGVDRLLWKERDHSSKYLNSMASFGGFLGLHVHFVDVTQEAEYICLADTLRSGQHLPFAQ